MRRIRKVLLYLFAWAIVLGSMPFYAYASANPPAPLVLTADKLNFSDTTGDIYAAGHVLITQNGDSLLASLLEGNINSHEVWSQSPATLVSPTFQLQGNTLRYNYQSRNGLVEEATGQIGPERIHGAKVNVSPDKIYIQDGTITTCPAKDPDYHISADRLEIWPGDKIIAYHAKFWIKHVVLFSLPKYELSLRQGASTPMPRLGFSTDGMYIGQALAYPLTDTIALYGNLTYYTRAGFKPVYGLVARQKNDEARLLEGNFRDANGNWIHEAPDFELSYNKHRLGELPVSYSFGASTGLWKDTSKSSRHQNYHAYLQGDALPLGSSRLMLGAGLAQTRESYDRSVTNSLTLDAVLHSPVTPRISTSLEYHYNSNPYSLFAFNAPQTSKEFDMGFHYRMDRLNSFSIRESYDLVAQRPIDLDYTWNRNLHCFEADITYRAKRKQITVDFSTIKF